MWPLCAQAFSPYPSIRFEVPRPRSPPLPYPLTPSPRKRASSFVVQNEKKNPSPSVPLKKNELFVRSLSSRPESFLHRFYFGPFVFFTFHFFWPAAVKSSRACPSVRPPFMLHKNHHTQNKKTKKTDSTPSFFKKPPLNQKTPFFPQNARAFSRQSIH